jgi:hypothetical protein
MSKVSALTGIPETTLAHWKNKADWWDEMVAEVRSQIGEAILAQNLQIATKAAERVLDSLENGDEKLIWDKDKREHVLKRVKPTGKDAAVISAISQDKARIQMNLPTSITTKTIDTQALAKQFEELSRQWSEKQCRVVAVQDEDEAV